MPLSTFSHDTAQFRTYNLYLETASKSTAVVISFEHD